MAKTENIFGELGGGATLNPSASVVQLRNNATQTYNIDSSKHYILTVECKVADTSDRTDVFYIANGEIQSPQLHTHVTSNYSSATISSGVLTVKGTSSNINVFVLVTLD